VRRRCQKLRQNTISNRWWLEVSYKNEINYFFPRRQIWQTFRNCYPDRQNSKKNGEIRVEILTKIKSGKAHIFPIFISVSFSTVINASKIYAFLALTNLRVLAICESTRFYYLKIYAFLTPENVRFSWFLSPLAFSTVINALKIYAFLPLTHLCVFPICKSTRF